MLEITSSYKNSIAVPFQFNQIRVKLKYSTLLWLLFSTIILHIQLGVFQRATLAEPFSLNSAFY